MTEIEALRKACTRIEGRIPVLIGKKDDYYVVRMVMDKSPDFIDGGGYYKISSTTVEPMSPASKDFPRDIQFKKIKIK